MCWILLDACSLSKVFYLYLPLLDNGVLLLPDVKPAADFDPTLCFMSGRESLECKCTVVHFK